MPDDPAPEAKPNTPSPQKDPPGIASGVMKKDAATGPRPPGRARPGEEPDGLANPPAAAQE
ncbi:MAG: hypothetical protein JWO72_2153 [Caulobacteraceae bacterium]|nr:hypothetical protein [Caulobacteraceae bacterium]